jgi:hypothetical protein
MDEVVQVYDEVDEQYDQTNHHRLAINVLEEINQVITLMEYVHYLLNHLYF